MFVVDSSRSVRPVEFEKVKVFLSQVIESLNVGPNATRVGVVNYASSVKQEFPLRAHLSKAALLQAVRRIRPLSTGTMTGLAIQFAITQALSDAEGGRAKSPGISKVHAPCPTPRPPWVPLGAESFAFGPLNSPNTPARWLFAVGGQAELWQSRTHLPHLSDPRDVLEYFRLVDLGFPAGPGSSKAE